MPVVQRNCSYSPCRYSGITLLNLIVSLSLLSIILGAGLPGLGKLYSNQRANSIDNRLFTLIQYTRLQAVTHRTQALLCPTKNRKRCIRDWSQPIMVFVDRDLDEKRDDDEPLLRLESWLDNKESLRWKGSGSKRYLRFKRSGGTGNQRGRMIYCQHRGGELRARQIIVQATGRIRRGNRQKAEDYC